MSPCTALSSIGTAALNIVKYIYVHSLHACTMVAPRNMCSKEMFGRVKCISVTSQLVTSVPPSFISHAGGHPWYIQDIYTTIKHYSIQIAV